MNQKPPDPPGEKPRFEPEIIPPGRDDRARTVWGRAEPYGTQRIYVTRLKPFTSVLLLLAIACIAMLLLVLLIGSLLIWIPVVSLIIAATIISAWWRGSFRR